MVTQREEKEKQKTRRTELGKFFYDLAKTTFAVMVVGNIVGIFGEEQEAGKVIVMVFFGLIATAFLASLGDRTLNK